MNPSKIVELNDLIQKLRDKYQETGIVDALLDPENQTKEGRINYSALQRATKLPIPQIRAIVEDAKKMMT